MSVELQSKVSDTSAPSIILQMPLVRLISISVCIFPQNSRYCILYWILLQNASQEPRGMKTGRQFHPSPMRSQGSEIQPSPSSQKCCMNTSSLPTYQIPEAPLKEKRWPVGRVITLIISKTNNCKVQHHWSRRELKNFISRGASYHIAQFSENPAVSHTNKSTSWQILQIMLFKPSWTEVISLQAWN